MFGCQDLFHLHSGRIVTYKNPNIAHAYEQSAYTPSAILNKLIRMNSISPRLFDRDPDPHYFKNRLVLEGGF